MTDLSTIKADVVVDSRGSACPGPLLEAKKAIGKVPKEGILEVWSNDEGTKNDLPVWAKKMKHEFLGFLDSDGYAKLFIRRKR